MSDKAVKEKKPLTPEKKRLIIILSTVGSALLLALIPIIIVIVQSSRPEEPAPAPEIPEDYFEGSYVCSIGGTSVYTFKEGNKVTNVYTLIENANPDESAVVGDPVTVNYTYEIVQLDGKNYIRLTDEATGVIEDYTFEVGKYDWYKYFCDVENCVYNKDGKGNDDNFAVDGKCSTHRDSNVNRRTISQRFVEISGEIYWKEN